jgi:hypothetical protein
MSNENRNDLDDFGKLLDTIATPFDKNLADELSKILNNMTNGEKFLLKIERIISNQERNSAQLDEISQSLKDLEKSVNESRDMIENRILDQYKIIDGKHDEFKQWVSNSVWWFIWIIGLCYGIWHYFIR